SFRPNKSKLRLEGFNFWFGGPVDFNVPFEAILRICYKWTLLFEKIENVLIGIQSNYGDYLTNIGKESELDMSKFVEFNPDNEISRFATAAASYDFKFTANPTSAKKSQRSRMFSLTSSPGKDNSSRRRSTFGNLGHRLTSGSTNSANDLMNDEFSDSTNNISLKSKKQPGKLKSTVGSIFGRNKLKNKKNQSSTKLDDDSFDEALETPQRPLSRSGRRATTDSIKPELFNRSSGLSSDNLRRTEKRDTMTSQLSRGSSAQGISDPFYSTTSPNINQPLSTPASPSQVMPPMRSATTSSSYAPMSMVQAPLQPKPRQTLTNSSLGQVNAISSIPNTNYIRGTTPTLPPARKDAVGNSLLPPTTYQQPVTLANNLQTQITGELKTLEPQSVDQHNAVTGQSQFQHSSLENAVFGLNASVAEVINATYKDGLPIEANLVGEVALTYIGNQAVSATPPISINLKVNNASKFEKVILNHSFLERVSAEEFKLNPQFINSRTLGALKYSMKTMVTPVTILPVWNYEPHQASVILTIKMSPTVPTNIQHLVLEDFIVYVSIDNANATSALSKPQGTFSKEKRRITWRFNEPLVLPRNGEQRLIARFMTDGIAKEAHNGVQVKFSVKDSSSIQLGSGILLQDQEMDENNPFGGAWKPVNSTRILNAGTYCNSAF
ncbi:hypothetical protein Kpol_2001p44, partial [Vanderwaltozyma polyspora DSM 70294]